MTQVNWVMVEPRNAYIASQFDGISDMCFGGNAIGIGTRIETVVGVANTAIAGSLNFVLPPLDYPQAATTPAGACLCHNNFLLHWISIWKTNICRSL